MKHLAACRRAYGWAALVLLLFGRALPGQAQFPATAAQTLYLSNAPNVQTGVQALADGTGGSFVLWIDKRAGNNSGAGTAIYAQHLTGTGGALLPAGGLPLFQTRGRDIFGLRAVPWQNGLLLAWVQGAFGIGGDTVRCQFYSSAGVPQWSIPTVVAYRTLPAVTYVLENGLNVFPTSTGATITYETAVNGGGDLFSFNQIGFTGALRFANNQFQIPLPGSNVFRTLDDGGNGFYVVSGSGGLGSALYAQHFDANGSAWAAALNLTATGANGRGNSPWRAVRDPAGNLYAVWGSNSGDVIAVQVTPTGALGWTAPGYRTLCTNPSYQSAPDALWHNNALWAVWNDDRTPASSQSQYMQRVDAAGTLAWPATGVLVNSLPAFLPTPRLAPADNGSVMAFYATNYSAGTGLRAQKVRPDGTLAFAPDGVALHTVDQDRLNGDCAPVAQPNGSVQVYWTSAGTAPTNQDICGVRVQPTGTLLRTTARTALGFEAYPNPAGAVLYLRYPAGLTPTGLGLYDARGRLVRTFAAATASLSLRGLAAGLYVLRATVAGQPVSTRVVVGGE